eukprot:5982032-Amphidinium_carterae.1
MSADVLPLPLCFGGSGIGDSGFSAKLATNRSLRFMCFVFHPVSFRRPLFSIRLLPTRSALYQTPVQS